MLRLIALPLAFFAFTSCQKDPEIPEPDSSFHEKKRPPYNEAVMSKTQTGEYSSGYQEDPAFTNDYQNAQREFSNRNYSTDPFTVQQIRDNKDTQQTPIPYQQSSSYSQNNNGYYNAASQQTQPSIPQAKSQEFATKDPYSSQQYSASTSTTPTSPILGEYELQAGAYRNEVGAKATMQKLEGAGIKNVRLDNVNGNYVIRIADDTPLNTRADASQFLQKVIDQSHHYDIMVVKR